MLFCPSKSALDLEDACVRAAWSSILPFALVISFLIHLAFTRIFSSFPSPLQEFLTLDEADALDYDNTKPNQPIEHQKKRTPRWFTVVLTIVGLIQTGAWIAVGAYLLSAGDKDVRGGIIAFMFASTWLYASLRPALKPSIEPPYGLVTLYIFHLIGASLMLGGVIFDHNVYNDPMPSRLALAGLITNLVLTFGLFALVLSRPLNEPSESVKENVGKNVSPEDYTTLFGWITFNWVNPLIAKGTVETLKEEDVWDLSVTMQARPVFRKFLTLNQKKGLLWKIWAANSRDIILDFVGTFASVFCNYLGPFFLKRIIDAIDSGLSSAIARAYLFAVLMLASQVLKAQADLQHLWYGRRASVRIRSQLMSAIYDKALKRKDFSGIVNQEKEQKSDEKKEKKKGKGDDKGDEPKAGADIGKIVNLMAGDANRIAMVISGMYFIYGAPLEIFIASAFLYQLLGVSAFAGFTVILLVWPLNNFLARRAVRIQKGVLAARDKRMGVVNELLGALKFIKFFAWEDKWIDRTEESRGKELKWLVKSRFNSVMFQAVWSTAPILVSVLSFLTYVVRGHELTVGTAFTAISLFSMIRQPLNVIPTWIVHILQTRVAFQRIETFLNEDEVGPQVSTLKEDTQNEFSVIQVLGLQNASLKWNAVEEAEKNDDKSKGKDKTVKTKASSERLMEAAITDSVPTDISQSGTEEEQDHVFELRGISVVFPDGALSVITGPTASGKTALLLAMLGEMTLTEGKILMRKDPHHVYENGLTHTISYAAQTPWLQHQSIKENILFGYPFDSERYAAVLDACALRPDLAILEDNDETEIGARGVSLSGGQKARVALARAIYARTKFVLLDDPLSAVDSHTARHLFQKLLMGPLLKDRTVVLVTHHVELVLPGTFFLVRMLDGRIDVQGTVKELRESGILEAITVEEAVEERREDEQKADEGEEQEASKTIQDEAGAGANGVGVAGDTNGEVDKKKSKKPRKLVKDEERETGSVKWRIYKTYLKASSYWTWAILVFLIVCVQVLGFIEKYWIKVWGEAYGKGESALFTHSFSSNTILEQHTLLPDSFSTHHRPNAHQSFSSMGLEDRLPPAQERPFFYVIVYALIGLFTVVVGITSSATQYTGALYASRTLFSRLLQTVTRCTMRWLDTTPTGRILNRFSKDIETVDTNLASSLQAVNQSLASFFTSLVVIVAVFPPFILPAVFIGYFYYKLAIGYLNTGRDLRRMESTTRSPIFSGFAELLEGIVTVRAFSAEPRFMNGLYHRIDLTLQMFYHFWWMTNRWLLLRFDFLSALAVFVTTMFALTSDSATRPGRAGWAALCITSAMQFTNNIYWTCRFWTQLELDLNSVERIVEYLDLPQEPPAIIQNSRPPAHWPSSSGPNENKLVEVKDLVIRYAPDLPAVLRDVSFTLRARERVGLLGRTGSGKSTLAMSLLRFTDPAQGHIFIDGVDIATIGVNDLRSRLTFIPQDATLFSGTIRDNLDPFGDYTDLECLDALRRVQMISESNLVSRRSSRAPSIRDIEREETDTTAINQPSSSSPSPTPSRSLSESTAVSSTSVNTSDQPKITLSTSVSSGGLNFSAGQRQLLAMARALLRRSAVVILDEATSSIDFSTDAKIQQTIREEFCDSLLLTIAHRLRTVIDYDRLLVLDQGQIVEFDTPYNLLQKQDGVFRGMCLKSGNFTELEEAANAKAEASTQGRVQSKGKDQGP